MNSLRIEETFSHFYRSIKLLASKEQIKVKTQEIAQRVLKVSLATASAWVLRSINVHATFIGFSCGFCLFYSPIKEIFDDLHPEKMLHVAEVAQGVITLVLRLAHDLIPWGISLSVVTASSLLGIYTRELITPVDNTNKSPGNRSFHVAKDLGKTGISQIPSRLASITYTSLSVLLKSTVACIANGALSWYGPNVSPVGFWCGFMFPKLVRFQLKDIKKHPPKWDFISLSGGLAIATVVAYPKKDLVAKVGIFALSALMGLYTHKIMYTDYGKTQKLL